MPGLAVEPSEPHVTKLKPGRSVLLPWPLLKLIILLSGALRLKPILYCLELPVLVPAAFTVARTEVIVAPAGMPATLRVLVA